MAGVQEVFGAVWDFVVATFENWISTFTSLADTVLGWFGTDLGNRLDEYLKQFFLRHMERDLVVFLRNPDGNQNIFHGHMEHDRLVFLRNFIREFIRALPEP